MYSTMSGPPPPWQHNGTGFNQGRAYIPVPTTRQTFAPSSLPPPPTYVPSPVSTQAPPPPPAFANKNPANSAPPPAKKKIDWSPAVRQYVQRSFASETQISGVAKEDMEAKLKQVITEATATGNLDSVDWVNLPLPQQMILQERSRSVLAPPPSGSLWPSQAFVPPPPFHAAPPEPLRKRKSSELNTDTEPVQAQPPWRMNHPGNAFEDRVSFAPSPDKRQKTDHNGKNASKFNASLENRKKRFEESRSGSNSPYAETIMHNGSSLNSQTSTSGPIVGTSQQLEKNYFRLTAAPNPGNVRPLEVLRKTLELLKKKWRTDSNYTYICDQFKSLRQDLTVQHIKNDFTTNVYEIHARIALEKGDLGEYNQCQTQLRALYKQNLGGHPVEFKAYRILYFIHTCNRTDMNDVLSDLTPADKTEKAIKHALAVRSALALGNYHQFFKLYLLVPHMGAYLMDMFVARERLAALASICKSYKPDVKIRFITEELAFEHDEETARFILEYAAEDLLQERDGAVRLLTGKAGSTFEAAKASAFHHVDIKGQI